MLTLLSCTQTEKKKTQNIEIYLTKNRIESYQGIELENSNTDTLKIRALQNRWGKNQIRLDTIKRNSASSTSEAFM